MDLEAQSHRPRYLQGYPSLAAFIASDRDQTSAIFKRFKRLGARNLLHMQSELAELQAQQDEFDYKAQHGDPDAKQFSRNWPDFCTAALSDDTEKERKELAESICTVLRQYREALFFESQLAALSHPPRSTLRAFRSHFFHKGHPVLGANSAVLFDDPDDLVTLSAEGNGDRLTAFVQDHLAWIFQSQAPDGNVAYASDCRIARFVVILSTINAATLLIGAIVSLYFVSSPKKKLGIIAVFTTLFAINVGFLTNARQAELFAASAAYAAVLVVFVSGNLGGSGLGTTNAF